MEFDRASAKAIKISSDLGLASVESVEGELRKLRAQYFLMLAAAERHLIESESDATCAMRADLSNQLFEIHMKPVLDCLGEAATRFPPGTVSMATFGFFHCSAAWLCHVLCKPVVSDKQQLAQWRQMRTSLGTYRKNVLSTVESLRDSFATLGSIVGYSGARLHRGPPGSQTAWEEIKRLYVDPHGPYSQLNFFVPELGKSHNSGEGSSESDFEEDITEEEQLAILEARYGFGPIVRDILSRTATRLVGKDFPAIADVASELAAISTLELYAAECSAAELAFLDCKESRKGKGLASTDLQLRKARYAKLHAVLVAVWDSYYRLYQQFGREAGVSTVANTNQESSKGKAPERASDNERFGLQHIHQLGLHNKASRRLAEPLLAIYTHKENDGYFATEAQTYLAIALGHAALLAHCWYPRQGAMDRDDRLKHAWERQLQDLVQYPEVSCPTTAPPEMTLRYEYFYDELKDLKLRDLYLQGEVEKCNPGYLFVTVRQFMESPVGHGYGSKEEIVERFVERVNRVFFTEAWVKEFQSRMMN